MPISVVGGGGGGGGSAIGGSRVSKRRHTNERSILAPISHVPQISGRWRRRKNLKELQKSTLDCNNLAGSTNYHQLSLRPNTFMRYMNYITAQ